MEQNDPILIDAIKTKVLWPPPPTDLNINLNLKFGGKYEILKGLNNQPIHVEEVLKLNETTPKRNGFFIEARASDGELFSNTLYFEIYNNWTGLLIEHNPYWLAKITQKNRNVWILPHCISKHKKVEIISENGRKVRILVTVT